MGDRSGPNGRSRGQVSEPERRPLLSSTATDPELNREPTFSCASDSHSHLPVYTNIHRVRRDIVSVVEDYLSLDQLRDVHINHSVVRPLVDKFYELDDISIIYCLLVNRARFLSEQSHRSTRQNAQFARATLCELVATRVLRRFGEDNSEGPDGLLVLAHVLLAGFDPFQNAPPETRREAWAATSWHATLPALEVAILSESKVFLSSTPCQKVVDAVYEGRIIYTPSSFLNLIPDRYKQNPISLYNPKEAPLLNQYRLIVPRTRNILEIVQFGILLALYIAFMAERDPNYLSWLEICFTVYAFGWVLDLLATVLEHGWHVYTQNLWSFLDVTFAAIYWGYLVLRIYGWWIGSIVPGQQALDVLAMGALVLIPRLAFNLLSDNLLFMSLRSMMADFALLSVLAVWCFFGFLLSLVWLGEGRHEAVTISKWMIFIWFGLDGTGIHRSTDFHWLLGPALMVTFAFLGNTLFLTILVSMLSHTFSTIISNATAEIKFRHAVMTLEGVKSDAIFAYQPPFNILAMLVLVPLKFLASPRWFHKIHVASVRSLNLPLLLIIAAAERRNLGPSSSSSSSSSSAARTTSTSASAAATAPRAAKARPWFWEKWRITAHGRIEAVFDLPPPDRVLDEIAADDEFRAGMLRRQFFSQRSAGAGGGGGGGRDGAKTTPLAALGRRDSVAPFPGLVEQLRASLGGGGDVDMAGRLEALEESTARIERLLRKLVGVGDDDEDAVSVGEVEGSGGVGELGTIDRSAQEQ